MTFAKLPDHTPEAIGFSALHHLERRQSIELLVRPLQPLADNFLVNDVSERVEQSRYFPDFLRAGAPRRFPVFGHFLSQENRSFRKNPAIIFGRNSRQ
jgi:hypothetical protein